MDKKKIILAGIVWGILFGIPLLLLSLVVPLFGIPLFLIFIPSWIAAVIMKLNGVKSFNPFTWKITKVEPIVKSEVEEAGLPAFCPKCGMPLQEGDRFCSHCGVGITKD